MSVSHLSLASVLHNSMVVWKCKFENIFSGRLFSSNFFCSQKLNRSSLRSTYLSFGSDNFFNAAAIRTDEKHYSKFTCPRAIVSTHPYDLVQCHSPSISVIIEHEERIWQVLEQHCQIPLQ